MAYYFLPDDALEYEREAMNKHLRGADVDERLRDLHQALAGVERFDVVATEQAVRSAAEQRGISAGKLIHPLRLALTGRGASPPVFDVAAILGKDRTLRRLQRLIDQLTALSASFDGQRT
jgi:glutamyl-tRNA synthetase